MITTTQKEELSVALDKSFQNFIELFSAFSAEEVNKLFPGSGWTPVQVASHIIKSCDGVPDNETEKTDRPYDAMLAKIRPWWTDMNQKFQSPDELNPGTEEHSKEEILKESERVHSKDVA
ncbi:MAG: hypothetical protein EOO02_13130, partial [Chitinophagaceae bacterium]